MKTPAIFISLLSVLLSSYLFASPLGETQLSSTIWLRDFVTYYKPPFDGDGEFSHTNFYIGRGYLRLDHRFSDHFGGTFLVNVLTDDSYYTSARVELKLAMASMNISDNFRIRAGIIPTEFGLESMWKYRIIPLSLAGDRRMIPSTDFGVDVTFRPVDNFQMIAQITNGEGYLHYNHAYMNEYPAISLDMRYLGDSMVFGVSGVLEKDGVYFEYDDERLNRFVVEPFVEYDFGIMDLKAEACVGNYDQFDSDNVAFGFMVASIFPINPIIEPVARFDIFKPDMDIEGYREIQILGGANIYIWRSEEAVFKPCIVFQPQWRMTDYEEEGMNSEHDIMLQLQINMESNYF